MVPQNVFHCDSLKNSFLFLGPHPWATWGTDAGHQREEILPPPLEKALLDPLPWGRPLVPANVEERGSEQVGTPLLLS